MASVAKFRILVRDGKDARVRPSFDVTEPPTGSEPPQAVQFRNLTSARAKVRLPGGVFDDGTGLVEASPFIIELTAKGTPNSKKEVKIFPAGIKGLFSFKVFCDETFDFAEGNSDPEFIVEN